MRWFAASDGDAVGGSLWHARGARTCTTRTTHAAERCGTHVVHARAPRAPRMQLNVVARKRHGVRLHEEVWSTSADLSIADESLCRSAHTVDSHALSQQLGVELLEVVVMIPPNIMGELMHERFSNPLIVSEALQ